MENLFTELFFAAAEAAGQTPAGKGGQGGAPAGAWLQCLMPLGILGIFYVLLIRPQQKERKKLEKMQEEITSGAKVVAAGMIGTITTVKKNSIILRTADSKIELRRSAIEQVIAKDEEDEEESK